MSWLKKVGRRMAMLVRGRQFDREMDEEMRLHRELKEQELVLAGVPAEEARYAAQRQFGNTLRLREESRAAWGWLWLEQLGQDVRFSMRMLRKNPGFTAVVVLTLALGIGANSAIFSLIDAVILRMLPVRSPEQLVLVGDLPANPTQVLSNPVWEAVRDRQDVFSGMFAWSNLTQFDLAHGGEAHNVDEIYVSGDYFDTLGVQASIGRLLNTNDDFRGCRGTAVLSYSFWKSQYGRDPRAVGSVITLDDQPFQIVGVSAAGFFGVDAASKFDVAIPICARTIFDASHGWTTSRTPTVEDPNALWLRMMGRLKTGTTAEQASARLSALSPLIFSASDTQKLDAMPRFLRTARLGALPAANGVSAIRNDYDQPLHTLLGITALVLLIACGNIACLLMARATGRRKEVAVRLALGASRWRLVRQLITESILLSVFGGIAGLILAYWSSVLLARLISTPRFSVVQSYVNVNISLDWRVLLFSAAIAVFSGLVFGILPSLFSTNVSVVSAMKDLAADEIGHRTHHRRAARITALQVALSLVLLSVAGLLLRSFWKLKDINAGFTANSVLLIQVNMHNENVNQSERFAFGKQILNHLRVLPGVTSASQSIMTPIMGIAMMHSVYSSVPGAPKPDRSLAAFRADNSAYVNFISPGYFKTFRTAILSGRDFNETDTAQGPSVAIINETMARKFFPKVDPVGRDFTIDPYPIHSQTRFVVVGVVQDAKYAMLSENFHATVYFPISQLLIFPDTWRFEIRSGMAEPSLERAAEHAVVSVDSKISLQFNSFEEQVDNSIIQDRVLAILSAFFGGVALLLVMIGLYGVVSFIVARRTFEIGIRIALGATNAKVLRLLLTREIAIIAVGIVVGLFASFGATRYLASLLYGVTSTDPATFVGASVLLFAVAALACYVPAQRAMRIDPAVALRHE